MSGGKGRRGDEIRGQGDQPPHMMSQGDVQQPEEGSNPPPPHHLVQIMCHLHQHIPPPVHKGMGSGEASPPQGDGVHHLSVGSAEGVEGEAPGDEQLPQRAVATHQLSHSFPG